MRRWSWRIGEFAGIGVYVHATFLLLLAWLAFRHYRAGDSLASTLRGILFVLAIFGCVVLHEFGHALTAKRYGIKTRDIILLPIGGVARLERIPDDPRQELWVAIAGPAVNVAIAALLYAWLTLTGALMPAEQLAVAQGPFLQRLMLVNLFLVAFNMLPAFPMDGGRVLRAFLAMRLPYPRATQIAATVGQGLALLFGFLGLVANPFLLFIALFVWIGASQESQMVLPKVITITAKSGIEGKLFGSVTTADIATAIEEQTGIVLDRKVLHLDDQIKTLGQHTATASLHSSVSFPVTLDVVAED